jgi:spermidine synthase
MSGRAIIFGCFLLSGFSALVYEIIWTRLLMHVFGSTVHAVSTVTAVFMGGLAFGSLLCGKLLSDNKSLSGKNPLKIYAVLEAATGIYGLIVPWLFGASTLQPLWESLGAAQSPEVSLIARAVVSLMVLVVPTSLIGATFPALSKAFARDETNGKVSLQLERDLAWLYGLNILGGTFGVLTCAFVLIPQAGLSGTTFIASGINLAVAATVVALANRVKLKKEQQEVTAPGARNPYAGAIPDPPSKRALCIIAACSGFLALFFEVAWTRFFALVMNSSIYSFATVLAVFLIGLAAGAWLVSLFLKYLRQPIITLALFYICSATYMIFCLYLANEMPWFLLWLGKTLAGAQPDFAVAILSRVIVVSVNVLIPAIVFGSVLPVLFKAATIKTAEEGAGKTAWIYGWNTIGAILGALVCGFVAIPLFSQFTPSGLQSALLLAVTGQVVLAYAMCLWWVRKYMDDRETRLITGGIASIILLAIVADICFFPPGWDKAAMAAGATFFDHADVAKLDHDSFLYSVGSVPQRAGLGTKVASPVLFYRDGLNSTVTVGIDPRRNVTFLKNNGKVEAAVPTDPKMPSEGSDLHTQVMLALVPMLLHEEPVKNVFVVGYGSGTTSGAVLSFPHVEKVTIAEIEQAVIDADKYFNAVNSKALAKDKVKLIVNDARYILSYDKALYDVIISQPADPWVAGASELFTVEFWKLAKERLAKNGVFSQWIQLYSITPEHFAVLCKTFQSVFPNCYLFHSKGAGEVILVGGAGDAVSNRTVGKTLPPEVVSYLDYLQVESFNLSEDLKLGPKGVEALWKELADNAPLNTDDNLLIEYGAGKGALTQQHYIQENIATINRLAAKSELSGTHGQPVSEE